MVSIAGAARARGRRAASRPADRISGVTDSLAMCGQCLLRVICHVDGKGSISGCLHYMG